MRSKRLLTEDFRDVCADEDGKVISFCVYAAADEGRVREHAVQLGSHSIIVRPDPVGTAA